MRRCLDSGHLAPARKENKGCRRILRRCGQNKCEFRERGYGRKGKPDDLVTLQVLAVSSAYEIAAIVAALEQKGLLTQGEVSEEIARARERAMNTHPKPHERRGEPDARLV
jgi:hypothetical protein